MKGLILNIKSVNHVFYIFLQDRKDIPVNSFHDCTINQYQPSFFKLFKMRDNLHIAKYPNFYNDIISKYSELCVFFLNRQFYNLNFCQIINKKDVFVQIMIYCLVWV